MRSRSISAAAVLKDQGYVAADALKAGHTPEAFLLDGNLVLRYRGRIDDSYLERLKKKSQTSSHDLRHLMNRRAGKEAVGSGSGGGNQVAFRVQMVQRWIQEDRDRPKHNDG